MALKSHPYRTTVDVNKLTPREAEVLALRQSGKTIREVAEALGIKYNTAGSLLVKAQDKVRYAN